MEEKLVLRMDSIVKTFPGVKALDGVHLDVRRGEVHALCGENGAGKSTLMKIIAGAQGYTSGHMYVNGEEVVFHSTKDAERKGIAMIYQEFNMVRDLSVAENMYLGRLPKTSYGTGKSCTRMPRRSWTVWAFGLTAVPRCATCPWRNRR